MRGRPFAPEKDTGLGRAILEAATVHIPDIEAVPASSDAVQHWRQIGGYRTVLAVPLMREGGVVGAVVLTRSTVSPFSDKQIELVETFADQAVIAIENVRLFDEVQARTRDLTESLQQQTATADVLKVISRSTFDLQVVLQTLVEFAAHLCDADKATITRQKDGVFFRAEAYGFSREFIDYVRDVPVKPERGTVTGRALLEGKIIHIADVLADPDYSWSEAQRLGWLPHHSRRAYAARGHPDRRFGFDVATTCGRSPRSRSSWSARSPTRRRSRSRTCACSTKSKRRTVSWRKRASTSRSSSPA